MDATGPVWLRLCSSVERRLAMAAVSSHPHITALYESGLAASGRPFLVMEYVAGGSLAARLPMPWKDALDIGVKVAGALETAHRIGIFHRDVKPENVLLSAYGEPMLADFGIAKVADSSQTPSGNVTASLLHAAPETLSGVRPSAVTDVYSLASTLFALIAGRAPYAVPHEEETLAPLVARIATAPVPDLRPTGVPDAVCAALESGLARDPARRPASAGALGERLREAQRRCGLIPTAMPVEGAAVPGRSESTVHVPASAVIPPPRSGGAPVEGGRGEQRAVESWRRLAGVVAGAAALVLLAATGGALALRDDAPTVVAQERAREIPTGAGAEGRTGAGTDGELAPPLPGVEGEPPVVDDGAPPAEPPASDGSSSSDLLRGTSGGPGAGSGAPAVSAPVTGGSSGASGGGAPGAATGTTGGTTSAGTSGSASTTTQGTQSSSATQPSAAPPSSGATRPSSPTPVPVVAPGAPGNVRSGDVVIESRRDGDPAAAPETVSTLTSWSAASGSPATYCLRWMVMQGSAVHSGPFDGGCTSGTSRRVTVPDVEPADSWLRWEVRASNSAGSSAWTPSSVVVARLVGGTSFDGTQLLRAAGLRPAYACLGDPPPGAANYAVTGQSPGAGTVLGSGQVVRMEFYETGC